jgi:hypothetical protein
VILLPIAGPVVMVCSLMISGARNNPERLQDHSTRNPTKVGSFPHDFTLFLRAGLPGVDLVAPEINAAQPSTRPAVVTREQFTRSE